MFKGIASPQTNLYNQNHKLPFFLIFFCGSDNLKPKRKPQGLRDSSLIVNERNVEQNIKIEIAKEIKPIKPKK